MKVIAGPEASGAAPPPPPPPQLDIKGSAIKDKMIAAKRIAAAYRRAEAAVAMYVH
jgi:hypothetical protein